MQIAEWRLDTPHLCSFERPYDGESEGFLGIEYGTGVDSRWGDLRLGPLLTTLTLSTHDGGNTPANANGAVTSGGMNATVFLYVIRGTPVAKVKISDMTLVNPGTLINLAEAGTSIIRTKTAAGTEEIAIGMAGTAYRVITTVANAGVADTHSANGASQKARILAQGPDRRVVAIDGLTVKANILAGTVTMNSPNWQQITTLDKDLTPTGFGTDADYWVLGTSDGPYMLDPTTKEFYPLIPELDLNTENCRGMTNWFPMGLIIPLSFGTRYQWNGSGESIGPEVYAQNTSPVTGRTTGIATTAKWMYWAQYNPVTTDTYLLACRPRELGDWHPYPLSFYTVGKLTTTVSNFLKHLGTEGGRTNPTTVGGHGSNLFYWQEGRTARQPDDTNYTYAASGTAHLTEMRRAPHRWKVPRFIEFETANCSSTQTVTVKLSVDGGTAFQVGATITSNGMQRIAVKADTHGWRIKPQIDFATASSSASPTIVGPFRMYYDFEPMRVDGVAL